MYNTFSDTDLIALVREGDIAAFRFLYYQHAEKLLGIIHAKVHNVADAEDCLQEIFIKFWNVCTNEEAALHSNENQNIEAYLVTAARNIVFTFYRKEYQRKLLHKLATTATETDNQAEQNFNRAEIMRLLQLELDTMPAQMRRIFELSRNEGLTVRQIAEKLSLSEQTVKNQVTKALRRLRLRFGHYLPLLFL